MNKALSTHLFLSELQRSQPAPRAPVSTVIGWGIRSPDNLGAVVRLAANFGCRDVLFVRAPHEAHSERRIRRAAVDGPSHVRWRFVTPEALGDQVDDSLPVIGLETTSDSVDLRDVEWPDPCALMIGSERSGLSGQALRLCTRVAHISTGGPVKSLNVSHALAIALFDSARGSCGGG